MRPLVRLCAWAWLSVLACCTESHEVERSDDVEAGNGGSQSGAGGRGGSGGRAGTGGSGGSGNAGSETCDTGCSGLPMLGVSGCCTDNDKCGLDISGLGVGEGCAELNAPGARNDACPSLSVFGGIVTFVGCCKPDGTCGVLADLAGLGCTATGEAAMSCDP